MASEAELIQTLMQVMRDDLNRRLDRIESKLDNKVDRENFQALSSSVGTLEGKSLTIDMVKTTVSAILQDAEARGWTNRERFMAYGAFVVLVINFGVGIYTILG